MGTSDLSRSDHTEAVRPRTGPYYIQSPGKVRRNRERRKNNGNFRRQRTASASLSQLEKYTCASPRTSWSLPTPRLKAANAVSRWQWYRSTLSDFTSSDRDPPVRLSMGLTSARTIVLSGASNHDALFKPVVMTEIRDRVSAPDDAPIRILNPPARQTPLVE